MTRAATVPVIGITAGDPAGIGPEVIAKALPDFSNRARWVLYGSPDILRAAVDRFAPALELRPVNHPREATEPGVHIFATTADCSRIALGRMSVSSGLAAIESLRAAADDAVRGAIDAIVTAPVSKEAIGGGFRGQTDYLAEVSSTRRYAMAFFTPTFKVVLVTVHVALRQALDLLSPERYRSIIELTQAEMARFGWHAPRIAIAAINPHAGEGGLFGDEDDRILRPVVESLQMTGMRISGPHSADSLYYRAHTGEFDLIVAPYHDQALAPVKLIAYGTSVNVTLGLPYVRTSPDHGTAFDIAGHGTADAAGMRSSLECALDLVSRTGSAAGPPG